MARTSLKRRALSDATNKTALAVNNTGDTLKPNPPRSSTRVTLSTLSSTSRVQLAKKAEGSPLPRADQATEDLPSTTKSPNIRTKPDPLALRKTGGAQKTRPPRNKLARNPHSIAQLAKAAEGVPDVPSTGTLKEIISGLADLNLGCDEPELLSLENQEGTETDTETDVVTSDTDQDSDASMSIGNNHPNECPTDSDADDIPSDDDDDDDDDALLFFTPEQGHRTPHSDDSEAFESDDEDSDSDEFESDGTDTSRSPSPPTL